MIEFRFKKCSKILSLSVIVERLLRHHYFLRIAIHDTYYEIFRSVIKPRNDGRGVGFIIHANQCCQANQILFLIDSQSHRINPSTSLRGNTEKIFK